VAVERLTTLEVHAVDVRRPAVPPARADVPDVDDLRPSTTARRAHVERPLQPEHLGHAQHRVLPQVLHVLVLTLAHDVDDLVEVQVACHASAPYIDPAGTKAASAASTRASSSVVSGRAAAATFERMCSGSRLPGIGTTCGSRASSHA